MLSNLSRTLIISKKLKLNTQWLWGFSSQSYLSQKLFMENPENKSKFTDRELDRIIEMAWEDRTTFDAIAFQFDLKEQEVIALMRREMKPSSFKMWRARVQGRSTKHAAKRNFEKGTFKSTRQKQITHNKISKR